MTTVPGNGTSHSFGVRHAYHNSNVVNEIIFEDHIFHFMNVGQGQQFDSFDESFDTLKITLDQIGPNLLEYQFSIVFVYKYCIILYTNIAFNLYTIICIQILLQILLTILQWTCLEILHQILHIQILQLCSQPWWCWLLTPLTSTRFSGTNSPSSLLGYL